MLLTQPRYVFCISPQRIDRERSAKLEHADVIVQGVTAWLAMTASSTIVDPESRGVAFNVLLSLMRKNALSASSAYNVLVDMQLLSVLLTDAKYRVRPLHATQTPPS